MTGARSRWLIDWVRLREATKAEIESRQVTVKSVAEYLGRHPNAFNAFLGGGSYTGLSAEGFMSLVHWLDQDPVDFLIKNPNAAPLPVKGGSNKKPDSKTVAKLAKVLGSHVQPGEDTVDAAARVLKGLLAEGATK